jgi:hypothetical protein
MTIGTLARASMRRAHPKSSKDSWFFKHSHAIIGLVLTGTILLPITNWCDDQNYHSVREIEKMKKQLED